MGRTRVDAELCLAVGPRNGRQSVRPDHGGGKGAHGAYATPLALTQHVAELSVLERALNWKLEAWPHRVPSR